MNHLHEYAEYGGFGEFYVLEIVAGERGRMPRRGRHPHVPYISLPDVPSHTKMWSKLLNDTIICFKRAATKRQHSQNQYQHG